MWNLKPDERIRQWRHFRLEIGNQNLEIALKNVSNLWSYAPYVSHYLHPTDLTQWPDPWVLLHDNYYCDLAKSLGMLYTLYLSAHWKTNIDDIEIRIYETITEQFNTVWVNQGKYILNLEYNTIVNKSSICSDFRLQHQITIDQLKLDLN